MMFVRTVGGQSFWAHERDAAFWVGKGFAHVVTAPNAHVARAGRREITQNQWRRELGLGPQAVGTLRVAREMQMGHASLDDGERTIELVAATDTPVRRREYDFLGNVERVYDETLVMSPGAVRLERMNMGAPLLDSHNYYSGTRAMVGAIVPGSAKVRGKELIARAKFSRSREGERAFQDAKDGILRGVSVGYMIHKREIDDSVDPPMHRITDWEPHEVSVVAIPADKNARFRSAQRAAAPTEYTLDEHDKALIIKQVKADLGLVY
jgi:HK97 family phage prohead protease